MPFMELDSAMLTALKDQNNVLCYENGWVREQIMTAKQITLRKEADTQLSGNPNLQFETITTINKLLCYIIIPLKPHF